MVKFCQSSRYAPTRCYDISQQNSDIIKWSTAILAVNVIVICVIFLMTMNDEAVRTKSVKPFIYIFLFIVLFVLGMSIYATWGLVPIQ